MPATATVSLGGTDYVLRRFNIGQLERVTEAISSLAPSKISFMIFRIALERAEPKIADIEAIEASPDEIRAAVETMMAISGLKKEESTPAGEAQGGA